MKTKLLTQYQKKIWLLYSQEGLTMRQIAQQLNLYESAVSRALYLVSLKLGEYQVRKHDKRAGSGLKGSRSAFISPEEMEELKKQAEENKV